MRLIATDGAAWSVCWSVGLSVRHDREPCKRAEPIEMPFGVWTRVSLRKHVLEGVQIPHAQGQFEGNDNPS